MKKALVIMLVLSLLVVLTLANADYNIYTEILGTMQMYNEEGNLTGSTVEIVKEIQRRIGDDTEIEAVPWARGLNSVQNEDNVILFSVALNDEREPLMKWVGPLTTKVMAFYVKKDSGITITSLNEAKKLGSIGTYRDDAREQLLKSNGFTNLDSSSSYVTNVKKLNVGRLDAVIDTPETFISACDESGIPTDTFEEAYRIATIGLYIAFSKNFPEETFNKWKDTLKNMYEDGTFETIYHEWIPNAELPEFKTID
jgi:polar amino acid transport system substrate-binding protein